MKRILILALALSGCLMSCNNDADAYGNLLDELADAPSPELVFTASISDTKVVDNAFVSGDAIAVSAYSQDGGTSYQEYKYSYDGSNFTYTSGGKEAITLEGDELYCYTAVYPSAAVADGETLKAFTFDIPTDQSDDAVFAQSDLLVANSDEVSGAEVALAFDHILSKASVTVYIEDQREDQSAVATASIDNMLLESVDLGVLDATSLESIEFYTTEGSNSLFTPNVSGSTYSVIVAPQIADSGKDFLTLTVKFGDDQTTEYLTTAPITGSQIFKSGYAYSFDCYVTIKDSEVDSGEGEEGEEGEGGEGGEGETPEPVITVEVTLNTSIEDWVSDCVETISVAKDNGSSVGSTLEIEYEGSTTLVATASAASYVPANTTVAWSIVGGDDCLEFVGYTSGNTVTLKGKSGESGVATVMATATDNSGVRYSVAVTVLSSGVEVTEPVQIASKYDGAVYAFNENTVQLSLASGEATSWEVTSGNATVSNSGLISITGFGDITVKASNNSSDDSVTISVPAGFIRQIYEDSTSSNWDWGLNYASASAAWNSDGYLDITSYGNTGYTGRADFGCLHGTNNGSFDTRVNSTYRYLAVHMTDIIQYDYIAKRVLSLQLAIGDELTGALVGSTCGNNSSISANYYYKLDNDTQVLVYDMMSSNLMGAHSTYSVTGEDEFVYLRTALFTYSTFTPTSTAADGDSAANWPYKWKLFSFHTFKSTDDVVSYIEDDLDLTINETLYDVAATLTKSNSTNW